MEDISNVNSIDKEDIIEMKEKLVILEEKIDLIIKLLDNNISKNCEKMKDHIDFIENIYDNVKNPLGFICSKINNVMGSDTNYSLEN